jgi:hypothetical protein
MCAVGDLGLCLTLEALAQGIGRAGVTWTVALAWAGLTPRPEAVAWLTWLPPLPGAALTVIV